MTSTSSKTNHTTVAVIVIPYTYIKIYISYEGKTSYMRSVVDGIKKEIPTNPQTLRGVLLHTGCKASIIPSNPYYDSLDMTLSDILSTPSILYRLNILPFIQSRLF